MIRRAVVGALALALFAGCGDDKPASAQETCAQAWKDKKGNAQAPGVVESSWLADCVRELGG